MSHGLHAFVLAVFILATSVWIGGYVAVAVVARTAAGTLDPAARVAFFKSLGRSYGIVGCAALTVALATGAVLLTAHGWDGMALATAVVAGLVVVALAVGIVQARRMTGLRREALAHPEDERAQREVARGARSATILRAGIGVLTVIVLALGAVVAG